MTKFKTTKKTIMSTNANVYKAGYCDLDQLFKYRDANAYTCGVYGWNADIYQIGNVVIVTGYRPFGKLIDYELIRKYNELARAVNDKYQNDYEANKKALEDLVQAFIQEVKELDAK